MVEYTAYNILIIHTKINSRTELVTSQLTNLHAKIDESISTYKLPFLIVFNST